MAIAAGPDTTQPEDAPPDALVGAYPASPAGPIDEAQLAALQRAPTVPIAPWRQVLHFQQRQIEFVFASRRQHGEVFQVRGMIAGDPVITSHPDHVRSIFTAKPALVPSLTAESPLRPIVGPKSVLTANGPRHLRQRKLLLPPFHGEAIARYSELIAAATDREIDRWPVGEVFPLAPRMQAITLDVIMAGIFGIEGRPPKGSPEDRLRRAIRWLAEASTKPLAQVGELQNRGRDEPVGMTRLAMAQLDKPTYKIIAQRRGADDLGERTDIMSLLLRARTEEGEALTDGELRDELLTLVLAGFETTANSLSWAWERLVRTPHAHDALRHAVRTGQDAAEHVEATIVEAMRSRPVIPIIGRRPTVPWQLGEVGVPAGSPISMSVLLVHHREDLYPDPFAFRPERWLTHKPGTYEWLPFGGGTRRCLGAALAMAEQRVVLETMARRLELEADDPAPERAAHRNVTMIPRHGARVRLRERLA